MGSYEYTKLPSNGTSIRLLKLLPSKDGGARIEATIFPITFTKTCEPYEALSYTWGDATKTTEIRLNGLGFHITAHLNETLRALRSTESPRNLWIDAVCINQGDLRERGEQVRMMWDIYKTAERTIVWLGVEEDDSAMAMDDIAHRRTTLRVASRDTPRTRPKDHEGLQWCPCHAGDFDSQPSRMGVKNILGRSWFTRVWVLQEVAAAKEVVFACGEHLVTREDFYSGLVGVSNFYLSFNKMIRRVRPVLDLIERSRTALQRHSVPLLELIESFRSWQSTEPVDKVYSLLAFSSDAHDAPDLVPDYTISMHTLARKLVHFTLPTCTIEDQLNDGSNEVTFRIDCFMLGKICSSESGVNQRSWDFYVKPLEDKSDVYGFKLHPLVRKIFQAHWRLSIMDERKIRFDDIVCLFKGASSPTILRYQYGRYCIAVIATPEPYPTKTGSSGTSWSEICTSLASEREGCTSLKLTWDAFRQPKSEDISRYQPKPNDFNVQWEARLESLKDCYEKDKAAGIPPQSITCGTISTMRMLYYHLKAEIEAGTSEYTISLRNAAYSGWLGTVKLLLDANADVDELDKMAPTTALHLASFKGHVRVVEALLAAKANVNIVDGNGNMPFDLALRGKHADVCKLLLRTGAKPNPSEPLDSGLLVDAAMFGNLDMVCVLLEAGVPVNAAHNVLPYEGVTALHIAAEMGHTNIVEALLEAGAQVNACTNTQTTPLHQAAMNGRVEVMNVLIAAGADPEAQDDRKATPLDFVAYRNQHERCPCGEDHDAKMHEILQEIGKL